MTDGRYSSERCQARKETPQRARDAHYGSVLHVSVRQKPGWKNRTNRNRSKGVSAAAAATTVAARRSNSADLMVRRSGNGKQIDARRIADAKGRSHAKRPTHRLGQAVRPPFSPKAQDATRARAPSTSPSRACVLALAPAHRPPAPSPPPSCPPSRARALAQALARDPGRRSGRAMGAMRNRSIEIPIVLHSRQLRQ